MPRRIDTRSLSKTLVAVAALSLAATTAKADREDWAPTLTVQIFDEHQCMVAFLSQVVEREVDGRPVVIAKAHCEDDRAFDIFREGTEGRFEIIECEVPNQEAC